MQSHAANIMQADEGLVTVKAASLRHTGVFTLAGNDPEGRAF